MKRKGFFVLASAVAAILVFDSRESRTPAPLPKTEVFWRQAKRGEGKHAALPFNPSDIVDRVSHVWTPQGEVAARSYRARISGGELEFTPVDTTFAGAAARIRFGEDAELQMEGNVARSSAPGVTRYFEAHAEGVELTWVIDRGGPARFSLDVSNFEYAGTDARGHHYKNGKAGVRIGNATAIDSAGHRWSIAANEGASQHLQFDMPANVLAEAIYPLAIDPLISPEFPVAAPGWGGEGGDQFEPSVAWNGQVFVVAWTEFLGGSPSQVRIARLHADGTLIDCDQVMTPNSMSPSVASNGTDFLLTYLDAQASASVFRRLDASGTLGALVANLDGLFVFRLASNAHDYEGVAVNGSFFKSIRIGADGALGGYQLQGTTAGSCAIASDGQDYLAIMAGTHGIEGQRISATGALLSGQIQINAQPGGAVHPALAWNAGQYFAAWTYAGPLGGYDSMRVVGIPVSREGTPAAEAAPLMSDDGIPQDLPTVSAFGENFLVGWSEYASALSSAYSVKGTVVTPSGGIGTAQTLETLANPPSYSRLLSAAGKTLLVWTDSLAGSSSDVLATFLGGDLITGAAEIVSRGRSVSSTPQVAFGDNGYLVAWQDNRNALSNRWDVYGVFVDTNGTPRSAQAFPIFIGSQEQTSPTVASSGNHYLVAWRDGTADGSVNDIRARILTDGILGPVLPICTETNSQRAPAAAASANEFLVVWRDNRTGNYTDDIYGAHVKFDGSILGPANGFVICNDTNDQTAPVVASNGSNYLVAWRDSRNAATGVLDDIYGAMVNAGDASIPASFPIAVIGGQQRAVDAASNGSDYFVVWRDDRDKNSASPHPQIYGTPVSATGQVPSTIGVPLVPNGHEQREPAIARLGHDYLLTWLQDSDASIGVFQPFYRVIHSDATFASNASRLSSTVYDPDVLVAAGGPDAQALVLSQPPVYRGTIENPSHVIATQFCWANCPIQLTVYTDFDNPVLVWYAEATRHYVIQYRSDFTSDLWHNLPELVATEDGLYQYTDDTAAGTRARFYRIQRLP